MRYDLKQGGWLDKVILDGANTPTAFAAHSSGVFVAFGNDVYLYPQDGSSRSYVTSTSSRLRSILILNDVLVIFHGANSASNLMTINANTFSVVDREALAADCHVDRAADLRNQIFCLSNETKPVDLFYLNLNEVGEYVSTF